VEICVNRLKDLGLNEGLANFEALRQTLAVATDRLAGFEAESLNAHVDFPLFQRIALPVTVDRTRIPGIKLRDTRMIRLMEVLLHAGTQLAGWRTVEIHTALLTAFGLTPETYSLTQLRYDVRKMKAHGLVERDGRRYCYRLTEKGVRVAMMFVLFHNGSAAHWRTRCFKGGQTSRPHCRPQSKRPTIKPMLRFKSSSTCSQHEI
jgi:hypothetical protein